MQKLRAKFVCTNVYVEGKGGRASTEFVGSSEPLIPLGDRFSEHAHFTPVLGDENKPWSELTPAGSMDMKITNPALFGFYKPGKNYFLDITEATEEAPQESNER